MGIPQKIWRTGLRGNLLSEANGFQLCIQNSAVAGLVRFMVLSDTRDVARPPSVLASGDRRSALAAMAAAERTAAIMNS